MDPQDIIKLEALVELVKSKPETLYTPELAFFKSYLESLEAKLPARPNEAQSTASAPEPAAAKTEESMKGEDESEESEVELDESGVVPEDDDLELPMGEPDVDSSEADEEKISELRGQAAEATGEGNLDAALSLYTEAIKLSPKSAALFAKRAQILLKMKKPKNAIKDASKAIDLNPDQPLAYRIRGRAHGLLGHWEQAASDLNTSLNIDYSEEANEWLKEVAGNAKKLHDHKRKLERKRVDKEVRERQERVRRAQEERKKAEGTFSGSPGGFPGMPGGFYGDLQKQLAELFKDPEVMKAFQDPEVAQAFQDITTNPANMMKYQGNPKVMALVTKLMGKMGIGGGAGAAMGGDNRGGMGNMFG
ncbi:hsc70-interacting protein-like [Varroa jacobsoni]|uniref:STI1 domain-containing protein n=1 Tax=Varroa destructor TaxID=109461 RepID=A0A7M7J9T9_VARDE|nr:hsc70-interacting protein-like [Varroa destructor]XP_022704389.1 hsc70-interacting protein-like [Varroa jacobsoni]